MALSAADEAAYSMLAMKLQRDVNCLADPERSVRRRAMDKLSRALQAEAASASPAVLAKLCADNLQHPLLASASQDSVEKCREKALTLLLFLAEKRALALSAPVLAELVALASSRLGKLPYPEHTEEIRLLLLQLIALYLRQLVDVSEQVPLRDVMADLANVLGKEALDPFPDVKKVVADCVIVIGHTWPRDVALQLGAIVRPLVTSLGHQHSRVRVSALQALEAAVPCGSEALPELIKETLLPALGKTLFDHAPSVRKQLVLTLAAWFQRIETIRQYETALLPLLLSGVVDESPEVREVTLTKLQELAPKWERDNESVVESAMDVDSDQPLTPPALFPARPPRGARTLATRCVRQPCGVIPVLMNSTINGGHVRSPLQSEIGCRAALVGARGRLDSTCLIALFSTLCALIVSLTVLCEYATRPGASSGALHEDLERVPDLAGARHEPIPGQDLRGTGQDLPRR
jgi:dynein assembly factor 5